MSIINDENNLWLIYVNCSKNIKDRIYVLIII